MVDEPLVARQQLELGRVLELTDLMVQGAKQQQWESVTELQGMRDRLIHEFFAEKCELEVRSIAEGIQYIIDSDKQLAALAEAERNALQAQIHKMQRGKNAVKAYTAR